MPDRITKSQRWLDLIALLLGRKIPLTVDEIMERVPAYAENYRDSDDTTRASTRRMFERDKEELRRAGIPIETSRYTINYGMEEFDGYLIERSDFYLPYLKLLAEQQEAPAPAAKKPYTLREVEIAPSEVTLARDALHRMAELPAFPYAVEALSALRKLSFDLGDDFGGSPVLWVEQPGSREVLDRLRKVSDALLARKRVSFVYHGIYRGEPTRREVSPYGLFFQRDWYLVGHDADRDALRVFRVARMEEIAPNTRAPKQPDFAIPDDFDIHRYLERSAWELGEEEGAVEAEVLFRFPLSIWAERNGRGELVRKDADGSEVRRFRVAQPNPFLRWVLSLRGDASVLSPPQLVGDYRSLAMEALSLYEAADG